jgi:hypothetical protein
MDYYYVRTQYRLLQNWEHMIFLVYILYRRSGDCVVQQHNYLYESQLCKQ